MERDSGDRDGRRCVTEGHEGEGEAARRDNNGEGVKEVSKEGNPVKRAREKGVDLQRKTSRAEERTRNRKMERKHKLEKANRGEIEKGIRKTNTQTQTKKRRRWIKERERSVW